MTRAARVALAVTGAAASVQVFAFLPDLLDGNPSFTLSNLYAPYADAVLAGAAPYRDAGFEYPPLALPVIVAPELLAGSVREYRVAFGVEMLLLSIAICGAIAFALRDEPRRMAEAVGVYMGGVIMLAPLPLERYDLAPAALATGAVLAREAGRPGAWGLLAGAGAAVKAYPLALFAILLADERRPGRALLAGALPLAAAAALVIALGDEFGSAVRYHTDRDLQVETIASSLIILAREAGIGDPAVTFGAGAFNIDSAAAGPLRAATTLLMLGGFAGVVLLAWARRASTVAASAAGIAVLVVLGPVLSPQFLLWLLPLSAIAFGLGRENLVLLAACATTYVLMDGYAVQEDFDARFVWPLLVRNALLVLYLGLIAERLLRGPASGPLPHRP